MKKLLAVLSVVLFADQASADVEYLCNAWSGTYSNEKPFILKKADKVITFKDYLGIPVTATYAGRYNPNYFVYLRKNEDNWIGVFYFNDHDTAVKELDATVIMVTPYGGKQIAAKCYRN